MAENPFTEEYIRGFREGEKHTAPSPGTKKWMEEVTADIKDIREEMTKLRESNIVNSLIVKGLLSVLGLVVAFVLTSILNNTFV